MRWIFLSLLALMTCSCSLDELFNNSEKAEEVQPPNPNLSDPIPCQEDQFVSTLSLPEQDELGLTDGFFLYSQRENAFYLESDLKIYKKERDQAWKIFYEHAKR